MPATMQILNSRIIWVFVRYKECSLDAATVWILTLTIENVFIQIDVVNIDGTVECQCDHLWHLTWFNVAWNTSSIGWTETIWQCTLGGVTFWSTVWIQIDGYLWNATRKSKRKTNKIFRNNFYQWFHLIHTDFNSKRIATLTASIFIWFILAIWFIVTE